MSSPMINFLKDKIENLLKIGSYKNVSGADGKLQEIQIKTLRNIEDAMKVGQFGFNSKAPLESRCIVAKIGNESIVIANEHIASIIDVATGDSIVYNANGDYVKVEANQITVKATNVTIDSTLTQMTGDLVVTGSISGASVTETTTNVTLAGHVHTGNLGNPTSSPTPGT